MNGRFLIARYISDLERQEWRNIGVIVWTQGKVASRFVEPSDVDFLHDEENYRRWVAYWQNLCGQKRLQIFNDPPVTNKTPRFLKALQRTQNGNYLLTQGGEVLDHVSAATVDEAAEFLYSRLVKPQTQVTGVYEDRSPNLTERCLTVLTDAGISQRAGFRRRYPVILRYQGFQQEIYFDFGTGGNRPEFLYNKVNIDREDSVTQAAGKCETAIGHANCARENCYSLFDSESASNVKETTIKFLNTFSVAVDISAPDTPDMLRKPAA